LLQTTFAIAKSVFQFNVDIKLTTNSGAEVPKATTVSHITSEDIPNFLASYTSSSINKHICSFYKKNKSNNK